MGLKILPSTALAPRDGISGRGLFSLSRPRSVFSLSAQEPTSTLTLGRRRTWRPVAPPPTSLPHPPLDSSEAEVGLGTVSSQATAPASKHYFYCRVWTVGAVVDEAQEQEGYELP